MAPQILGNQSEITPTLPTYLQSPPLHLAARSEMHRGEQGVPAAWACEAQRELPPLGELGGLSAGASLHPTQP